MKPPVALQSLPDLNDSISHRTKSERAEYDPETVVLK
jgi:hypothetical protein